MTEKEGGGEKAIVKTAVVYSDKTTSIDLQRLRLDSNIKDSDPYKGLAPEEAAILKRQVETPDAKIGVATLYRYATTVDIVIVLIGVMCSIVAGVVSPLMTVFFGGIQGTFADYFNGTSSYDEFMAQMSSLVLRFVYLGVIMFISTYFGMVSFIYTGEHISGKIRVHYLQSCLKQNIGFFDNLGSGEVVTRITANTNLIQEGISEKFSLGVTALTTFLAAFVIGFIECWKLTLILFPTAIVTMGIMGYGSRCIVKYGKKNVNAYALGGTVAEETLSSVRNAVAFGTQDRLASLYDTYLVKAEASGVRLRASVAVIIAVVMGVSNWSYGLAFWQGSKFLIEGTIPLQSVTTVAMATMIGSVALGNVLPNIQALTTGLAGAAKIYATIDRVSTLDSSSEEGAKLEKVEGHIRLENIKMIYPSRPQAVVMDNVSLNIPAGKTTALVGASGSGKSTIIGLVERFYQPVQGKVYLDGHDTSTLNLRWLRQQISLVSQEPTLFGTTIYENIRHGLIGTEHENATPEEQKELIEAAAVKAYAHDFISALPEGYQTNVGERGFLLSGGQKQRIAIARAIVSDPKILLLDEATSALDSRSEGVVQAALEQASEGRTTIAIAHRLSTIRDADCIVVMSKGKIVEQGKHQELVDKQGTYYSLVTAQAMARVNEAGNDSSSISEEEPESDWEVDWRFSLEAIFAPLASASKPPTSTAVTGSYLLDAALKRNSVSSLAMQGRKPEEQHEYSLWTLFKILSSFNKEERGWMVVGFMFAVLGGGSNPVMSLILAHVIVDISLPVTPETIPIIEQNASFWCLMYMMLGFVSLFCIAVHGIIFALCAERLVHRARDRAFRSMLRQDVEFFDRDENSAGALTSFLSTQTTHLAGLSGATLGSILMSMSTLVSCIVVAIAVGWKLALVCMCTVPIMLAAGFFRVSLISKLRERSKRVYEGSASFASEAITAVRTVASLTREDDVLSQYRASLANQLRSSLRSILKSTILYAGGQGLMFLCYALGFWYGGTLLAKREYSLLQFFLVFTEIVFGAQSAGSLFSFGPDMSKSRQAAAELKHLFDRKPLIDPWSADGERVSKDDRSAIRGRVEFRDVHFRYPTRPTMPVLRGLSLQVEPGQYIALVGPSGCGKSTTIALLERFYNALAGGIFVDGRDISSLNVNDYRSFIALVSQEPTLYAGTIRDNILLGAPDRDSVTDAQIERVCREANAYEFIMSLPDGMNTVVGSKGALLSGGQKQRIAIARALIRDPKILLLDEATSALDSESEHVVQAALDRAAKGRTTIAVAHRLSTISKADCIYVFDKGVIAEAGTHAELMKVGGKYGELVKLQSLEKR